MDKVTSDIANLNLFTPHSGSDISEISPEDFETPHRQNAASTNIFIKGTLEERRKAVEEDLGPIPEVSLDFMLKLTPQTGVNVDATLAKLKAKGVWTENTGWKSFNGQTPLEMATKKNPNSKSLNSQTESKVFENLNKIYDSIISNIQFHDPNTSRKPTLTFEQNPNRVPISRTDIKSRPDGYGVLTKDQEIHSGRVTAPRQDDPSYTPKPTKPSGLVLKFPEKVKWLDIACVEEYKLHSRPGDRNDNVNKMIWSLHHIMNVDHRRRFCFGITVENVYMRVWFACRQAVIVTRRFDFTSSPSQLVKLITSLAFAKPTELGYDPTMKLQMEENGYYCYDIECSTKLPNGTIKTEVYRTKELLSDSGYNLRGRATRVYLVQIHQQPTIKNGPAEFGRSMILKDSWIDTHRIKEGDVLEKLLRGASSAEKNLFLTVFQHAVVQIEEHDDHTQELILKGRTIVINEPNEDGVEEAADSGATQSVDERLDEPAVLFYLRVSGDTSRSASGATNQSKRSRDALRHNTHRRKEKAIVYSPKVHYRVIFEEVGESLTDIVDSGRLTTRMLNQVMEEVTRALQYMAKRGYVHRDVSTGNIILYNGHARLTDLDFSKEYGTKSSPFVRTGTYSFMAGEVLKGKYSVAKYFQNKNVPLVYNPVHDLESLWWVGVYCILWHYPAPYTTKCVVHSTPPRIQYTYRNFSEKERKQLSAIQKLANVMFPSVFEYLDFDSRMDQIHDASTPLKLLLGDYPAVIHSFNRRLDIMRQCISLAYHNIQSGLPRPQASYFTDILRIPNLTKESAEAANNQLPVHDIVMQAFADIKYKAELEDAILWPVEAVDDRYKKFLETGAQRAKLRPRKATHAYVNRDAEGNYHEC